MDEDGAVRSDGCHGGSTEGITMCELKDGFNMPSCDSNDRIVLWERSPYPIPLSPFGFPVSFAHVKSNVRLHPIKGSRLPLKMQHAQIGMMSPFSSILQRIPSMLALKTCRTVSSWVS